MNISESESVSCSVMSNSLLAHGLYPPGSSAHGILQARITGVGCHSLLQRGLPDPGIEPESPTLGADSLLCEARGKPPNNWKGNIQSPIKP